MAKRALRKRVPAIQPRRKNILIDQVKLDAVKLALGLSTETAAVDAALDLVVFRGEVADGLRKLAALGGLEAVHRPKRPK
jgi:Arc/MetJ family transcription regulator